MSESAEAWEQLIGETLGLLKGFPSGDAALRGIGKILIAECGSFEAAKRFCEDLRDRFSEYPGPGPLKTMAREYFVTENAASLPGFAPPEACQQCHDLGYHYSDAELNYVRCSCELGQHIPPGSIPYIPKEQRLTEVPGPGTMPVAKTMPAGAPVSAVSEEAMEDAKRNIAMMAPRWAESEKRKEQRRGG